MSQDFIRFSPLFKAKPIVCSNDKDEPSFRVCLAQSRQCMHHVGRTRELHLKITDPKVRLVGHRKLSQVQPDLIFQQFMAVLGFEWVKGGNEKPELVQPTFPAEPFSKSSVPKVYGVERTSVDSGSDRRAMHIWRKYV